MKVVIRTLAIVLLLCVSSTANATLQITFANGDTFDGDDAGDTAGPFTDAMSGVTGTITTSSVSPAGAVLNSTAGALGINASGTGDDGDSFDNGESWSFSWNVGAAFAGIDFASYDAGSGISNEQFSVSSPAWIGLARGALAANVTFTSGTGTFAFGVGHPSDDFSATDIGGTAFLPVGSIVTISFATGGFFGGSNTAEISDISFNLSAVPEPSAFLFGGLVCGVVGIGTARRWFGKKSAQQTVAAV